MGSGASTPSEEVASQKGKGKSSTNAEISEPKLVIGQDNTAAEKVASDGRMRKLALGQQGYKDQQRDYDDTLSKLELNKTTVMEWTAPSEPKQSSTKSLLYQPSPDTKSETKVGGPRKTPQPPRGVPPGTSKSDPTTQVVMAPSKIQVGPTDPNASFTQVLKPGQSPNANKQLSEEFDASTNHSYSLGSSHNGSALQLKAGPPPGIISRPFPRKGSIDEEDEMCAKFVSDDDEDDGEGSANLKRPDSVPQLNIPNSSGNNIIHAVTQVKKTVVSNGMQGAVGSSGSGSNKPVPPSAARPPQTAPAGYQSPMMTYGAIGGPPGSNRPRPTPPQGPPSIISTALASPNISFTLPNGTVVHQATRGTGAPILGGGAAPRPAAPPGNLPIVKETTDVKRNKVQIPTNLGHAQPTTGDWLNKRYFVNNYILLDTLGQGSYGEVRLCKDRVTDKLYAIKIISKDFLKKKKSKSNETYFEDIKREIAIMKKLLHPNVLRLFEVLDDPKVNKMYLVLEYMKMGDLINILKSQKDKDTAAAAAGDGGGKEQTSEFTPLSDLEVWNIFRQVVSGIRYLHYQNIVHGDIKPQNLLLDDDGVVKIADFGISQMLSQSSQKLADAGGTPAFMSPELCEGKSFSGQLADVWAIGATIFMLRFGHPPFMAKTVINLYHKICADPLVFPGPIDPGLRNLLENILEKDPQKRFTLENIIMHPWFRYPPAGSQIPKGNFVPRAATSQPNRDSAFGPPGNRPMTEGGSQQHTPSSKAADSKISFQPPPSYLDAEAAAMNVPVYTVNNDEVFQSIGGGISKVKKQSGGSSKHRSGDKIKENATKDGSDDDEDEDGDDEEEVTNFFTATAGGRVASEGGSSKKVLHIETEGADAELGEELAEINALDTGNIMATNWGADVFEMVDDGEASVGEESVDDSTVASDKKSRKAKLKTDSGSSQSVSKHLNEDSKHGDSSDNISEMRSVMSHEEEMKRSRRFMKKISQKPSDLYHGGGPMSPINESAMAAKSFASSDNNDSKDSIVENVNSPSKVQFSSNKSLTSANKSPSRLGNKRFNSSRDSATRQSVDLDEETDQITMEDFAAMMDTLAQQQPRIDRNKLREEDEEDAQPITTNSLLKMEIPHNQSMLNVHNGMSGGWHSEQGIRPTQEDRCQFIPNLSEMKHNRIENQALADIFKKMSLACIFDGHSGSRSSQYLHQHLPYMLATSEKFLDKKVDGAFYDTFRAADKELCMMLLNEEDASGSTALVALFDGRKNKFTVAGVGDTMCVLSRSGHAVTLGKTHRLQDSPEEQERIKKAGGTVSNNRVHGLLAVSRAFGDTQFKVENISTSSGDAADSGVVISRPDIETVIVTPMTEFAVLASDGLWDVMAPQVAVNYVRNQFKKVQDLQKVAKLLVQEAIQRGSIDNVTVVLLTFHGKDSIKDIVENSEHNNNHNNKGGKS